MHIPSEEWNLRTERLILLKCLVYRRPMNIRQKPPPTLKPMNLLLGLWLDSPSLNSLLMNTAHPKPSMNLPGDRYSMPSPNCNSSAIEFPNKLNFRSFDLALVYLSIWVENYVYVTAQTYII